MRHRAALAGAAGLVVSVAALVAAFMASVERAVDHFDRAAVAQAQYATVLRLQGRLAARPLDRAAFRADVADYAALIARETALLPDRERSRQHVEAAAAAALGRVADAPDGGDRLPALVGRLAGRERAEADATAAQMRVLRRRAGWIAALLALVAGGSAVLGAAGLFSANRRLSREVAVRTQELVDIDRSRRLFFAKASHELRTPVTVMRGEAEVTLADRGASVAALRESLAHVVAQTEFLEHRLAELLGLSQAEEGRIVLASAPLDLADAVDAAVRASERFAASMEVSLARTTHAAPLSGDRRWLEQAIVAVLDNAIKFSPAGGAVSLDLAATRDRATLTIADRGAGLAAEALPRIFDAYYQADAGRARGGTGLGLALARWVIERHGGTIAAANLDGGGCVVTLTLPLAATP